MLRIVLMMRPTFWVEGVTLHVGPTLFEEFEVPVFLKWSESGLNLGQNLGVSLN